MKIYKKKASMQDLYLGAFSYLFLLNFDFFCTFARKNN